MHGRKRNRNNESVAPNNREITPADAKEDKQLDLFFVVSMPIITEVEYSRNFRKQPPKMQRLRFREVGGRSQESNHRGPLPRCPSTSALWKIICCMQFLSYSMSSSMLLL